MYSNYLRPAWLRWGRRVQKTSHVLARFSTQKGPKSHFFWGKILLKFQPNFSGRSCYIYMMIIIIGSSGLHPRDPCPGGNLHCHLHTPRPGTQGKRTQVALFAQYHCRFVSLRLIEPGQLDTPPLSLEPET